MADYGITPNGPNIKRLDKILEEMHDNLSERWGVNTRQKPESFLNWLLTTVADHIAELWEFGESVYYSQYPSTAEGVSLDNVAQYGGVTREPAAKSYYPIHCTGTDGLVLVAGTSISSTTNPEINLSLGSDKQITRSSFNKAVVKIASRATRSFTISLNGTTYGISALGDTADVDVLRDLASLINRGSGFTATVDESSVLLSIEADDIASSNVMLLSSNLTTETVTSIISFGTDDTGDIYIPDGVITNIKRADAGLLSVVNLCPYISGREDETDTELRQSYIDKIYNRSSMMLDSIRSSILNNVQGVKSVTVFENDSNSVDDAGRPPHSIEVLVDGGDSSEIATQILAKKAAGVSTFGSNEVELTGLNGESITIRFNRPSELYIWMNVVLTCDPQQMPADTNKIVQDIILDAFADLDAGEDVIPQRYVSQIHAALPALTYVDITLYATDSEGSAPSASDYTERIAEVSYRQRAYTDAEKIGVSFADGD